MPKSEVLSYSRSKFNATAVLYKLAVCKGKIYGIVLYEIAILLTHFMKEYFNSFDDIGPPKQDRKQGIKTKTICPSVFTLIYFPDVGLSVCPFFGCSLISHELLDKTYIYAHHQNGLNEEIKIICFICRSNVYFLHN